MAQLCFSSEHSTNSHLVYTRLVLVLALGLCTGQDTNTIFLNSCERCEAGSQYEVSTDTDYLVTLGSGVTAGCSWECKARVYSSKNSSWVCLAQLGIVSQINDSNGELAVYDSHRTDPIVHLKYYPILWHHREECRKTEFLDFDLRKIKSKAKLRFEKLRINFQVLDIESTKRVIYLDGTYCTTEFKLLNSQLSIYNQPEETEAVTYEHTLASLCGVPVEIVDTQETKHKRICFYYLPTDQVNCSSNWSFSVSIAGYSITPSAMIYTLNCGQNRSQETHAWCADPGIRKVTVIFQRNKDVLKSVEPPRMFRFLVLDYNGTAESLMAEKTNVVKELLTPPQDEATDNNNVVVICIVVGIAVAVLLIVMAFLYSQRGCLSGLLYGPVHNPENGTAC
ncbi:hypothetical protein BsWGS_18894 [Bradybaena similaris]